MKKVTALLCTLVLILIMSACNTDTPDSSPTPSGSNDQMDKNNVNTSITGSVSLAVPNWNIIDMQELIVVFNKSYPNVAVDIVGFEGDPQTFLTAQASANNLPDALWGDWGSIPFSVSQGWLLPLNDLLEEDDERDYIPQNLLDDITYKDMIFALPNGIQFNCVVVNNTLVDELNMDMPEYNWTMDEFIEFIKDGASTESAGIELLAGLDEHYTALYNNNMGVDGYNVQEKSFNLEETWISGVNLFKELRNTPHVEAWVSRNSIDDNDVTDYEKKFGVTDLEDMAAAFKTGNVLTMFCGSWDTSWLRHMPFEWEIYPMPQSPELGDRLSIHANHTYLLEGCEDIDAAFALIKYLTYGRQGNIDLMEIYENKDPMDVTSGYLWYFPSTSHPDVDERLRTNEHITDGAIYMYTHMDNTYRGDMNKIVPGWDQVFSEILSPSSNEVREGSKEAARVAAELDREATKQIQNYWNDFEVRIEEMYN